MEKRSENKALNKLSIGFGVLFLIASILNGMLIVAKGNYAPLKNWIKFLSGHHWITRGIFVLVLFVALKYIFSKVHLGQKIDVDKTSGLVSAKTVLGALIIVGFFFKYLFE
jgi:hypothetical protein